MRWQYMTITTLVPWDDALNAAGAAGWELVAMGQHGEYEYWAVFKRPRA